MGEVLFRYWPGRIPLYQMAFEYWCSRTTEYHFAYHRYVTSVDANKFKGPVAISKVVSGFRRIEEGFWAKDITDMSLHNINHDMTYAATRDMNLNIFPSLIMTSNYKNMSIIQNIMGMYMSKDMQILNDLFLEKEISMSIYHGDGFASGHRKEIQENTFQTLTVDMPKANIYEQTMVEKEWPETNIYKHLIIDGGYEKNLNRMDWVFSGEIWRHMDIYDNMYAASVDRHMQRFNDISSATRDVYRFEPLSISGLFAQRESHVLYILDLLKSAVTPNENANRIKNFNVSRPDPELEIFENIIAWMDDRQVNIHNDIAGKLPDKVLNHIAVLFGWRDDPHPEMHRDFYAYRPDDIKHTNKLPLINAHKIWTDTNVFDNYNTSKKLPGYSIYEWFIGSKDGITGNVFDEINGRLTKGNKDVLCNTKYTIDKPPITDTVLNLDTFVVHDRKYSVVFDTEEIHDKGRDGGGKTFTPVFGHKTKGTEGGSFFQQCYSGIKGIKETMVSYDNEFVYGLGQETRIHGRSAFVDKNGKLTITQDIYPHGRKNKKKTDIPRDKDNRTFIRSIYDLYGGLIELVWLNKYGKPVRIEDNIEWFEKIKRNLRTEVSGLSLDKQRYQLFWPTSSDVFLDKKVRPLSLPEDIAEWLIKKRQGILVKEQHEFLEKMRHSLWTENTGIDLYKRKYELDDVRPGLFLDKTRHELDIIKENLSMWRKPYVLSRFSQPEFLQKYMKPVQTVNDMETLWRTSYQLNLFFGIGHEDTIFIPISKTRKNAFIDRINEFLSKEPHLTGIPYENVFASPIPREAWMEYNPLFCFKEPYRLMVEYENEMVFKLQVKVMMQKKEWSCDKLPKHLMIDPEDEWTSKSIKELEVFHDPDAFQKMHKPLWMYDTFDSLYKSKYNMSIFKDEWTSRTPNLLYYTYGVFAEQFPKELGIFDSPDMALQKERHLMTAESELWADVKWRDIFLEDVAVAGRELYESNLFQQALHAERKCREIEEFTNDFSNWAWVYEVPDPLEPAYGIDELLLPENDTKYSDFENLIFDSKTMRPRNPVKQIDSTTFIAKYPTKHPFPERADVGRYYDDSAIKFENYYGIESEIMYIVYLQFFKIWQAKIFEFGGMDMVSATKRMLEYIYTWIIGGGLPLDKVQQGLRVYRQIRWFAESAVIRNSQYVVTYELDALHSNLHTGKCDIPNDLHPGGSMYVDQNLAVIRCDPSTIDNGPASVTFFLDTYRNSIMTFSLLNTVGSVNIYVDGNLVDTRSVSGRVSVDLIYTGDTIEVTIEKTAANNRNKYFYIGDITVPDLSYKDLKVSFDPTLKMGNKPLDEVMKKMLQYANLYDDINEAYAHIRESNLGVNETYRLMLQYWELHHKNKIKGKRLTIKET